MAPNAGLHAPEYRSPSDTSIKEATLFGRSHKVCTVVLSAQVVVLEQRTGGQTLAGMHAFAAPAALRPPTGPGCPLTPAHPACTCFVQQPAARRHAPHRRAACARASHDARDAMSEPTPPLAGDAEAQARTASQPSTSYQADGGGGGGGGGGAWLAAGAVALGAVAFFGLRLTGSGAPSLATLQRAAVPLEAALASGRPTVLEFYAGWCEVCRELAPMTYEARG